MSRTTFLLLIAFLFIGLSCLIVFMFHITRCNDPADPAVRERIRKEWNVEWRQHEQQKQIYLAERDEWRREEDEHRRLGLSWSGLSGQERCLSYDTREYTARLQNIPAGYNQIKACLNTPIVIHGVTFEKPSRCEDDVRS